MTSRQQKALAALIRAPTVAAAPAVAGGAGGTTNTYNITVNGIEELEELLRWYESRQVRARMA